jgi:predicted lipoprotein with Yx(FWY)xxD motif
MVAGAVVGVVALTVSVTLAPVAVAHPVKPPKTAVVVQVVNRPPFGDMLATVGAPGASLYTTSLPCTGSCLIIWPPLVIPKGKKIPTGVAGLSTAKLKHHRRQITYNGKRLYTFTGDSGGAVTGNNVENFVVATTP